VKCIIVIAVVLVVGCPGSSNPSTGDDIPDDADAFGSDYGVWPCISTSIDPENVSPDPEGPVLEFHFDGVVRRLPPGQTPQLIRPWGNCYPDTEHTFELDDATTGITWRFGFEGGTLANWGTIFNPNDGESLTGDMAVSIARTGAMQIAFRRPGGDLAFAMADLDGPVFNNEREALGFNIARNTTVRGAEQTDWDCGPVQEIALDFVCEDETLTLLSGNVGDGCGMRFTNSTSWIPTGLWECTDLIAPMIWWATAL
jgi:hypothetical protein